MLVIEQPSASVVPDIELVKMLNALSVGHVSRYPINVKFRGNRQAWFVDSRFPLQGWSYNETVAVLSLGSDGVYVLNSNRIENEKYSCASAGYHERRTGNAKKMLKLLREVTTSFSPYEITKRSDEGISYAARTWKEEPKCSLRDLVGHISQTEVLKEIMYLKSVGVEFRSDNFKKVASEAYELQLEAIRREKAVAPDTSAILYVYEQPDGIVSVVHEARVNSTSGAARESAHWIYENMDVTPEAIRQQMSLLKMCEVNQYVPEVGKRDEQNGYWVHVDRDKFSLPTS